MNIEAGRSARLNGRPAVLQSHKPGNRRSVTSVTCLSGVPDNYPFRWGFQIRMINKITNSLLVLAVGGLMFAGSAAAQTTTSAAGPGVVDPGHPRVNEVNGREENQQKRIANGINSGSLNPHETANLERREASVQNQEQRDMAKHNGHLTKVEQRHLNERQDRISHSIYKDKHNGK
jgi:hypothetical protein